VGTRDQLPQCTIAVNTVGFALAFAAWVMFGPSVRGIAAELGISEQAAVWIKAAPILTGSVLRVPVGVITDRLGARWVFSGLLAIGAVATLGLSFATTATHLLVGGVIMGLVGTTFVVGVQSVSSWSPSSRQGTALGLFGVGNVGTAITTLCMPFLLATMGWRSSFRIYAFVLTVSAFAYFALVRDVTREGPRETVRGLLAPLEDGRTWLFGLYYMATFGVFVAGALCFGDMYIDQYGVSMGMAGILATTFTFTAGFSRIFGGTLSDRFGARPVLSASLVVITVAFVPAMLGAPLYVVVGCIFVGAVAMGIGMSATLKYIPDVFPGAVGAVGGMVGALGGVAGFFLPLIGAPVEAALGSPSYQIAPLLATVVIAFAALMATQRAPAPYTDAEVPAVEAA